MFSSETQLRVRYGETDQMGYVYYGYYALYYEVGRVEALRQLGMSYREMEAEGVMLPVMEMNCRYLKAARYDDLLTIRTTIKELPAARITFDYEILNESAELLNKATVSLVFINRQSNRPARCPSRLLEKLKPYFSNLNE